MVAPSTTKRPADRRWSSSDASWQWYGAWYARLAPRVLPRGNKGRFMDEPMPKAVKTERGPHKKHRVVDYPFDRVAIGYLKTT
jgi:hypothetical protein